MVNIIKLNAIDSTNTYLIDLGKNVKLLDGTIVVSKRQLKGRGQLGAAWQSQELKSLTFSVFKSFESLPVSHLPSIVYAVSIGVYHALNELLVPHITIKWPNDIMSYSNKLAGILIENQIKKNKIVSSVIGIGLNVNEENFKNLPQATSILLATGRKHNLEEILQIVSGSILKELDRLEKEENQALKLDYEKLLFRKNIVSVFEDTKGIRFNGKIKGVSEIGELLIENDQEIIKNFKLKEIKYLF